MPSYVKMAGIQVTRLEKTLDQWNATLPPLQEFILPRGNLATTTCHLARTICRRAERRLVSLHHREPVRAELLAYLNRLSDLLFVAARILAVGAGQEVLWDHPR